MKNVLFALGLAFSLSNVALAETDLEWARRVTGFTDTRVVLEDCSTSHGTSGFGDPQTQVDYYCRGTAGDVGNVILIRRAGENEIKYFTYDGCRVTREVGEQAGGEQDTVCSIRELNADTLVPFGRTVNLYYHASWDYSEGYLSFRFRLNGLAYAGHFTDLETIREDQRD